MKKSYIVIIIIVVLLAGGAIALSSGNKDESSTTTENMQMDSNNSDSDMAGESMSMPNTVVINDFKFKEQNMTIKKGTTITWKNTDSAKHDINFSDESLQDSELLAQDETYEYTFNTIGSFDYTCSPHPFMKGMITVTE